MDDSIQIEIPGEEFETIAIALTKQEVTALYQANKERKAANSEFEKKISSLESTNKYERELRSKAESEISQAHTLLTALGIQEKTDSEISYNQQTLPVSTRIALYIAKKAA
jgi:hypothetical protein